MIGDRIRQRRTELGWTMEELAKKMGYSTKSTISLIENGKRDITQSKVIEFAKVLGVSIAYLMEWDDENRTEPDYTLLANSQEHLIETSKNNDRQKAMELYNVYLSLPPEKRAEFEQYLEFLQLKSKNQ